MKGITLSLVDQVAIVTGAGSGIGRGIALRLAEAGCRIAVWDIQKNFGEETVDRIQKRGGEAQFYQCDVTQSDQVKPTIERVRRDFGTIDILVNNAGIIVRKDVVELTEEEWDRVVDVGLKGVYLVSHFVLPHMIQKRAGCVVNIGSGWSMKGGPKAAAYCAAKAGVLNLTRAMAIDYGPYGIRINCVCPGDVDTPLLRNECKQLGMDEEAFMEEAADRPLRRVGTPEDIANAVLYFVSPLSRWVTGACLVVDGGGLA